MGSTYRMLAASAFQRICPHLFIRGKMLKKKERRNKEKNKERKRKDLVTQRWNPKKSKTKTGGS